MNTKWYWSYSSARRRVEERTEEQTGAILFDFRRHNQAWQASSSPRMCGEEGSTVNVPRCHRAITLNRWVFGCKATLECSSMNGDWRANWDSQLERASHNTAVFWHAACKEKEKSRVEAAQPGGPFIVCALRQTFYHAEQTTWEWHEPWADSRWDSWSAAVSVEVITKPVEELRMDSLPTIPQEVTESKEEDNPAKVQSRRRQQQLLKVHTEKNETSSSTVTLLIGSTSRNSFREMWVCGESHLLGKAEGCIESWVCRLRIRKEN